MEDCTLALCVIFKYEDICEKLITKCEREIDILCAEHKKYLKLNRMSRLCHSSSFENVKRIISPPSYSEHNSKNIPSGKRYICDYLIRNAEGVNITLAFDFTILSYL